MKSTMTSALALSALFLAAPVGAQQVVAQQATAQDDGGIADIVVTAQKRAENVQDVPIAISAFTGEALRQNNVKTLADVSVSTPGLTFGQTGSDPRPSMRGVPTPTIQVDGDPSLGFHIDGVYQARTISAAVGLFDLERLEVQRGPQGTLNGRNTTGGNISIITQGPTKDLGGYVNAGFGNYDSWTVEGAINLPISETLQMRVAGLHREHDFYARNAFDPKKGAYAEDLYAGRASVRWEPTSRFSAVARFTIARDDAPKAGFLGYKDRGTVINANGVGAIDGRIDLTINPLAPGVVNSPDRGVFSSNEGFFSNIKTENASLNMALDLGAVRLASITGYNHIDALRGGDFDFSELNQRTLSYRTNTKFYSQEVHLASTETEPLEWIVGGYVSQEEGHEDFDYTFLPGFPVPTLRGPFIVRDTDINYKSIAGFGQASYYILPSLRVTAGGRYTRDNKNFISFERQLSPATGLPFTALDVDRKKSFSKFTWKGGIDYFFEGGNMLYGSVATGFRSGGFNRIQANTAVANTVFQPETVTSYEIGTKNRFFGRKLQLNLAAFRADYKDAHISQFVGGGLSVTTNAGKVRAKGIELEAIAAPTRELRINLSGQILDARYRRFSGCVVGLVAPPANIQDCGGNRIERSPKFKATLGGSYDIELGSLGKITPRATSTYTGAYYNVFTNTKIDRQKAYFKTDLRLGWTSEDGRFSLEGYVENLENTRPIQFGVTQYEAGQNRGGLLVTYGNPRTYGLRGGVRF